MNAKKKKVLGTCRKISGLKATGHASTCILAACGLPPSACATHAYTHTHSLSLSLTHTHTHLYVLLQQCVSLQAFVGLFMCISTSLLVGLFMCIRKSLLVGLFIRMSTQYVSFSRFLYTHQYVSFSRSLYMHEDVACEIPFHVSLNGYLHALVRLFIRIRAHAFVLSFYIARLVRHFASNSTCTCLLVRAFLYYALVRLFASTSTCLCLLAVRLHTLVA